MLPVDSEHNAIHQCLHGRQAGELRRLILTASGGPFRGCSLEALAEVTAADALKHPTWQMGPKITVDSATLMNKGLEVIEAHWLFGVPPEQIDVVVHPQSIVHSMVELKDGSIIAQMGITDMRLPIQYAFAYPDRWDAPVPFLDLTRQGAARVRGAGAGTTFPACGWLTAPWEAGRSLPIVLNAANEVAVSSFLEGRLGFTQHSTGHRAGDGCPYARAGGDVGRGPPGRRLGPETRRRARPGVRIEIAMTTLLAFLFVLGVLVFIHELGHFLLARWNGVRVLTFSLGFGPKLLKFQRGDTEYRISAIPLGGYVKMAGENPDEPQTGAHDEFMSKTKWQRFQILIAGPVMNLLLAVVLLAVVLMQGADVLAYLDQPGGRRRGAAGIAGREGRHPPGDQSPSSARPTFGPGNTSTWRSRRVPSVKSTSW